MPMSSGMTRFLLLVLTALAIALPPDDSVALELTSGLRQYHHTAWTLKDGGPGQVSAIAQTKDGYLWLGTPNGLFRFDGVRFERVTARSDVRLRANEVFSLLATADGGLWVGYTLGGATRIEPDRLRNYGDADGLPLARTVYQFSQDAQGRVWAITPSGPRFFEGGRWRSLAADAGYPPDVPGVSIVTDKEGTLWLSTRRGVFYRRPTDTNFLPVREKDLDWGQLSLGPDGRVWISDPVSERGTRPLQTESSSATWQDRWWPADQKMLAPAWDRDGALWFGGGNGVQRWILDGLADPTKREAPPRVEAFGTEQGLSGDFVRVVLEDREGTVWVGTNGGLDRFRPNRLIQVELPGRATRIALAAAENGNVWVSSYYSGLFEVGGKASRSALLEEQITCIDRQADGTLWLGRIGALVYFDGKHSVRFPPPGGNSNFGGEIQALGHDGTGAIWVGINQAGPRLLRLQGNVWEPYGGITSLPQTTPSVIFSDVDRGLWFGYPGNQIAFLRGRTATLFGPSDGLDIGDTKVFSRRGDRLWIAGEFGLSSFDGSRFRSLRIEGDTPLSGISGMIETASGDLWLNGSNGITHLSAVELNRAIGDPRYAMRFERFDRLDGLPGTPEQLRPVPTAAEGTDGKLWFALTNGVVTIDPANIRRNPVAPSVVLQDAVAGGTNYPTDRPLKLHAGISDLRVDYAALSMAVPERLHFRYRLEGFDQQWRDAGGRRQAFYTNVPPGNYRFRVVAANEDGVWNEEGAAVNVEFAPAFYQTLWFAAFCAALVCGLMWSFYRARLARVAESIQQRAEAKQMERERIARELHDTLLQGTQGLIFGVQAAANTVAIDDPAREILEDTLERADRVIAEGRDRIQELRVSIDSGTTLPMSLAAIGTELATGRGISFRTIVEGRERELRLEAKDETYLIAREALLNAFRHARARSIEVQLNYSDDGLVVCVRDDGRGFDEEVLDAGGAPGHWGVKGMRERAARIGARLDVWSAPDAGTEIELCVSATTAFGIGRVRSAFSAFLDVGRNDV